MKTTQPVTMGLLEEPPFSYSTPDGPSGCDVDLATALAQALGLRLEFTFVVFTELLTGVADGTLDMTMGMFPTGERRRTALFTRPIWKCGDGLIVARRDMKRLSSYKDLAGTESVLGVVTGQVQHDRALARGVPPSRIVEFATQDEAIQAVRLGYIDAAASTHIGNSALVRDRAPALVAIPLDAVPVEQTLGSFAVCPNRSELFDALDRALARFLGSSGHIGILIRHGLFPEGLPPSRLPEPSST
jgi:polar amino acid transport system substrate-binding protein